MPHKLLIWGAGGHGRVVMDIIRSTPDYEVAAFMDDVAPTREPGEFEGVPLYYGRQSLDRLRRDGVRHVVVAIGDCPARLQRAHLAREAGFALISAIHPRAIIAADARVDDGTVVAAGAVIAPAAAVGENVIINTCASVDHESVIEAGAHVGVGVRLGGRVRIGRAAFLGMGAIVLPGVHVGEGAVIGAGAVVLRDVSPHTVAYGVPARHQRRTERT